MLRKIYFEEYVSQVTGARLARIHAAFVEPGGSLL
jgi:hypothetical protein